MIVRIKSQQRGHYAGDGTDVVLESLDGELRQGGAMSAVSDESFRRRRKCDRPRLPQQIGVAAGGTLRPAREDVVRGLQRRQIDAEQPS